MMRLSKGQLVCGVDSTILRSAFRRLIEDWGDGQAILRADDLARWTGATLDEAADLLHQMTTVDIVREHPGDPNAFVPEAGFFRISAAAMNEGIPRIEADKLVKMVVAKAISINNSPDIYWHRVKALAVFGSYLTDADVLGDIDIAFELTVVPKHAIEAAEAEYRINAFRESVKRQTKTEMALRLRRPNKISLHTMEEIQRMGCPYRPLI